MSQIEIYINELFNQIPNSGKARKRKSDLITENEEKFSKYKKIKKNEEAAFEAVKSEIGSLDKLRESLPATGTVANIVATVFFIIFAVSCFVAAYFRITDESYELMFDKIFEYFKIAFARPMRWGTGGFLVLWTLARYSVRVGPYIKVKTTATKSVLLVLSSLFFIAYIFSIICVWAGSLSEYTKAVLPTLETLWSGGQYFMFIPGAALFLGLHK